MRTQDEVEDFKTKIFQKYVLKCKLCAGTDSECFCRKKSSIVLAAYEACVPQDFWFVSESDVKHNRTVFDNTVIPYVRNLKTALRKGYGLLFLGDNGVGKTYFMSYILMKAIRKGRSVYFTTMPTLDYNIKRGFKDAGIEDRLNWMLTSDFVAIDELGKERSKSDNKYMDSQVERILKQRFDDGNPMLLSANMDAESLETAYGPTIASMLVGKFQTVVMEPGDFRESVRKRMIKEMKYV